MTPAVLQGPVSGVGCGRFAAGLLQPGDPLQQDPALPAEHDLNKVLVVILGVATAAQIAGFPIGSIVAGAGLVGLTISLAAQESASNLFSGIVILLDKPFAVGDWITVGDVEGEVIDINFRSTRIRSQDKTVSIVTNSKICSSTVQNAALRTMRPYKFTLGVTYNTTRPPAGAADGRSEEDAGRKPLHRKRARTSSG